MAYDAVNIPESAPPRVDRFDPFLNDGEMRQAYVSLVDGRWNDLEDFFDSSPTAWLFSQTVTSQIVGIETVTFQRWVAGSTHAHARSLYAAALIRDAFEQMASTAPARASSLSELPARDDSTGLLEEAESLLFQVIDEVPASADPWVYLLMSGRGLGIDLGALRSRFDEAHSRSGFRADACHHYLQGLTSKWGGSQQAVFEFARWVEAEAPPDSAARQCLPIAHIEQGLLETGNAGFRYYHAQVPVAAELMAGADSFLQATATTANVGHLPGLNAYALGLNAYDQQSGTIVAEVFNRIANRPTAYPWTLYQEAVHEAFHQIQSERRTRLARYR